ncbi:ABC transporter ATP-binding protein [Gottschalkiaceae bacterium SANA]|nr:ABC transporter ATP-binding protein [Gottschalkiaceae bacterium SANA]
MNTRIEITNLQKKYGRKVVIQDMDLTLESGKVYGLLGPNGQGKTTLIKCIAGLLTPEKGQILINGEMRETRHKGMISMLADKDLFYKWMTVEDTINFYDTFFEDFDRADSEELIRFMELVPQEKVEKLSKGMKARLKLVLVLSRKAKIYLLDEPLSGIDPVSREKIVETILGRIRQDAVMVISSHMVHAIESLLDEVIMLSNGKIIAKEEAEVIRSEKGISIDEYYLEVFRHA